MLLDTGKVDVDLKDQSGRTSLSWAAQDGWEAVVKMLLDTGKVDVDLKDQSGRTSLSWAAQDGWEAAVKVLLDTGEVDVDSKDQSGRTPLSWVAGQTLTQEIARKPQPNFSQNIARADYQTQLMLLEQQNRERLRLARMDHDTVPVTLVRLLLEVGKANVVLEDNYERTPLHWAAQNGRRAMLKALLDTGRVSVNSKDKNGCTPLSLATQNGHEAVVQLLLSYLDIRQ